MSYKTILVHADMDKPSEARFRLAAALAIQENAHLVGLAVTGISRFFYPPGFAYAGEGMTTQLEKHLDELRQRAQSALDAFKAVADETGVKSFELRQIEDEAGEGISLQARYSDLAVIGQSNPEEPSPVVLPDFPEFVITHSGRPVLIVPHIGAPTPLFSKILIAWDAGIHAARSVTAALPLLKRAQNVDIVVFNPDERRNAHGEQPGADHALYLARHGINVNVIQKKVGHDVGHALLSTINDLGTSLLVMGAYGHSRFREILLGGTTHAILKSMRIPTLMMH